MIPQRGLSKAYEWERIYELPGSNFSSELTEPTESREGIALVDTDVRMSKNEALVEMQGVCVRYGDKEVLGSWEQEINGLGTKGLSWTIRRGERWGVFGPNGMYLGAYKGTQLELIVTRIWKNNTRLPDLL